ncbi:helix-turn-helix domain-containing protein [Alkalihalobacillus hemicellulosilyticus]|uniref:DNA-binding protein n=1 Tax=Halalkalibacter hemicellulosilyticusJCM 9152 TaxID=1236971 RepID=W4QF17_9BACI|nr:XRE family transcriptional regulator [Halalkalibacter hemicellulosilyticus]GAE30517.1 DNA-binding protein [Halalkalibacter hemicellulosilyticusJCM 9152]
MDDINVRIAAKLKSIRKSKGFSLEQASNVTGVSKAMLGQIERGLSNPTVSVLWKIANGLKVSFSSFFEEEEEDVALVSFEQIEPITESNGHYNVYPIFPFKQGKQFEIYTIQMEPHSTHMSEAHQSGVEEYIIVTKGTLILEINDLTYTVTEKDAIHFIAHSSHIYRNETDRSVSFQNILYYSNEEK